MLIRAEKECDRDTVHAVNISAFETRSEADLVDALRQQAQPVVSLVAEENGEVIGHIMFSPVFLSDHPNLKVMGLAPMAVAPAHQKKGLVRHLFEQVLTSVDSWTSLQLLCSDILNITLALASRLLPNLVLTLSTRCQRRCLWQWNCSQKLCAGKLAE